MSLRLVRSPEAPKITIVQSSMFFWLANGFESATSPPFLRKPRQTHGTPLPYNSTIEHNTRATPAAALDLCTRQFYISIILRNISISLHDGAKLPTH